MSGLMQRLFGFGEEVSPEMETIKHKGSNYNIVYKRHSESEPMPASNSADDIDKSQIPTVEPEELPAFKIGPIDAIDNIKDNKPETTQQVPPSFHIPKVVDPNLVVYHDPNSVEAEIFKVLRNNILFPKDGTPPPSILVTSAMPEDGKSFIAANLAISIAMGIEDHVLLMDCDMRRSNIHRKFGYDNNVPGLSEYLSKDIPLHSLLKKTPVDKLTILPGGRIPDNPSELLSSQRMKGLLHEAINRYKDRFIILDSPPPRLTAETTALAKYVDGILIVIRAGVTKKSSVEDLVDALGRDKIIGVVLNGYHIPATERYGYGKYGSYSYEKR